jgi:hypothetical protein
MDNFSQQCADLLVVCDVSEADCLHVLGGLDKAGEETPRKDKDEEPELEKKGEFGKWLSRRIIRRRRKPKQEWPNKQRGRRWEEAENLWTR